MQSLPNRSLSYNKDYAKNACSHKGTADFSTLFLIYKDCVLDTCHVTLHPQNKTIHYNTTNYAIFTTFAIGSTRLCRHHQEF